MTTSRFNRQLEATAPHLPYHPSLSKPIEKILASHDIKVTDSSATCLRDLLTKTKTSPPPHLTPNASTKSSVAFASAMNVHINAMKSLVFRGDPLLPVFRLGWYG